MTVFTAPKGKKNESIKYGKGVSFDWEVFAAPFVQLTCSEIPALSHIFPVPDSKEENPTLVYCGGVKPEGSDNHSSCTDISVLDIVPYDPVNNFYLQALDENKQPIKGQEQVGPVTVTLDDYPAPAFEKTPSVPTSVFGGIHSATVQTFCILPEHNEVPIKIEVKDYKVVAAISIINPSGDTIKSISKEVLDRLTPP